VPVAPRMIPYSGDPFIERGIRFDPDAGDAQSIESGGILVEWNEVVTGEITIGGYNLYKAAASSNGTPGEFAHVARIVDVPIGNDTSYSDTALTANIRYWYYVRAYTRGAEVEGPPSDTVFFSLTARPIQYFPIGAIDSAELEPLIFRYGPSVVGGAVALHLDRVRADNERIVLDTVWRKRAHGSFVDPQVVYDGPPLQSNSSYRWRVDKIAGSQPSGNASSWVTFVTP
ncbi:MAG: fibronectin type III domain-containing protein, partial [bacterium]|nr:fibronectin type III domain-containing protein [Candidatus Kapabacteria bacterium]